MESFDIAILVVVVFVALVILLALAYLIKRKCCQWLMPKDELDGPFDATDPRRGQFVTPSTRNRGRPSYADVTRYRVENERSRPRPYDYTTDWTLPTPTRPPRPSLPVRVHQGGSSKRRSIKGVKEQGPPGRTSGDVDDINQMILAMQGNLREDSSPDETIYNVQKLLLSTADRSLHTEDCRLLIGVDATPAAQAGYCVNVKERRLDYYVVKRDDLPWVLHDPKDPSEFEMKNFMFALTVWEDEILRGKRIRIYTDNFAITKAKCFDDNKYGDRAFRVLRHFSTCKGVKVLNINNMAVNRFKDLKCFAKYIQPADDLSRWRISEAIDFLTKHYGIDQENVHGTHCLDWNRIQRQHAQGNGKVWYKPKPRYKQLLHEAREKINCHDCHNASCTGSDLLHASLRIKIK